MIAVVITALPCPQCYFAVVGSVGLGLMGFSRSPAVFQGASMCRYRQCTTGAARGSGVLWQLRREFDTVGGHGPSIVQTEKARQEAEVAKEADYANWPSVLANMSHDCAPR
jgi:hypothetical protein